MTKRKEKDLRIMKLELITSTLTFIFQIGSLYWFIIYSIINYEFIGLLNRVRTK